MPRRRDGDAHSLQRRSGAISTGLGLLGIGLGLAELLAPERVSRRVGMRGNGMSRRLLRAMGVREIASGVGLLASRRRSPWLWMRVGGDLLDLALLRAAMGGRRSNDRRLGMALVAIAGVTVVDAVTAKRSGRHEQLHGAGPDARMVTAVVTIRRPVDEVYAFFRDFSNLPSFMKHVVSVEDLGEDISHWVVRGPGGRMFEWDAEIVKERTNEILAWKSLPGGDIENDGVVRFVPAPGDRGTEVHAKIRYRAPGGRVGALIAKLFGREPGQQARGDLRRLKQVLETGDVVRSDASIHRGMHAARPSAAQSMQYAQSEEIGR